MHELNFIGKNKPSYKNKTPDTRAKRTDWSFICRAKNKTPDTRAKRTDWSFICRAKNKTPVISHLILRGGSPVGFRYANFSSPFPSGFQAYLPFDRQTLVYIKIKLRIPEQSELTGVLFAVQKIKLR
jgi:hypothetical protein